MYKLQQTADHIEINFFDPKYTCHAEVREGQRNHKEKPPKMLTGKSSFLLHYLFTTPRVLANAFQYTRKLIETVASQKPPAFTGFFSC